MNMKYEKSCGFVVYRMNKNTREYLFVESNGGKFGFPKGHMEKDETEIQTACRELREETNLETEKLEGFRKTIEYRLVNKADTMKEVVFFIGKYIGGELKRQECEIARCVFMSYEEALPKITLDEVREVLEEAHTFLNQQFCK